MTVTVDPSVYTDIAGLAKLRAQANQQSPEALRQAAKQFEALFLQMMLKSMRDARLGDGLMESDQTGMYREMYDKQLSLEMTKQHSLGLADMMVKQLGGGAASTSAASPAAGLPIANMPQALQAVRAQLSNLAAPGAVDPISIDPGTASVLPALRDNTPPDMSTPQAFVQSVWPHAQRAARELGVKPEVLVAQAALETGWGRSVMQHPDGRSSNNLFGIKASPGWDGPQVMTQTLEYQDGIPVRTRSAFRSYGSCADSFNDYVDFLKGNPRYRAALAQAGNAAGFAQSLQNAGYATDPAYAQKISSIVNGDTLQGALSQIRQQEQLAQLKQADRLPLS